ncbi:hypothetical protein HK102_006071 [Quaeritorhiza haematococci]|nr:hypothetical protein HK102_006071 [Quaeritorhiza haematococci]
MIGPATGYVRHQSSQSVAVEENVSANTPQTSPSSISSSTQTSISSPAAPLTTDEASRVHSDFEEGSPKKKSGDLPEDVTDRPIVRLSTTEEDESFHLAGGFLDSLKMVRDIAQSVDRDSGSTPPPSTALKKHKYRKQTKMGTESTEGEGMKDAGEIADTKVHTPRQPIPHARPGKQQRRMPISSAKNMHPPRRRPEWQKPTEQKRTAGSGADLQVRPGYVTAGGIAEVQVEDQLRNVPEDDRWFADLQIEPSIKRAAELEKEAMYKDMGKKLESVAYVNKTQSRDLFSCLRDPYDGLQHLTPNQQWFLFQTLVSRGEDSGLTYRDYLRLLRATVRMFKFNESTPPEVPHRVLQIFKTMKKHGVMPDAPIYACLYRAFKDDAALVKQTHSWVMKQIIKENIKEGRLYRTSQENTIHLDRSDRISPIASEESFRTLLAVYLRAKNRHNTVDRIPELWTDMRDAGVRPTAKLCIAFLEAYRKLGDLEGVRVVHESVNKLRLDPDRAVFRALLKAYAQVQRPDATRSIFNKMQRDGIRPTLADYKILLDACDQDGMHGYVLDVAERIEHAGFTWDNDVYKVVFRACVSTRNISRLQELHQRIKQNFEVQKKHILKILRNRPPKSTSEPLQPGQVGGAGLGKATSGDTISSLSSSDGSHTFDLTPKVYLDLMAAYAWLDDVDSALNMFSEWKRFINWCRSQKLQLYFNPWNSRFTHYDQPTLIPMCTLVHALAKRLDLDGARDITLNEVFSEEYFAHRWRERLSEISSQATVRTAQLESQIESVTAKQGLHKKDKKQKLEELMQSKGKVKLNKTKLLESYTGEEGLFEGIYNQFSRGWERGLSECKETRGDDDGDVSLIRLPASASGFDNVIMDREGERAVEYGDAVMKLEDTLSMLKKEEKLRAQKVVDKFFSDKSARGGSH